MPPPNTSGRASCSPRCRCPFTSSRAITTPGCRPTRRKSDGLRIVACNTAQPGRDDGALDVEWLRAQLVPDVPTVIAMHHPPIDIGITFADEIGLPAADTEALAELLRRSPQVKGVVAGHVHRTVAGTLGGCPVLTCTSTNIQAELDFTTPDMLLTREPPSILVHAWLGAHLVTHVHPVESHPV